GDVRDVQFIETEQPRLSCNLARDGWYWITGLGLAGAGEALVDVCHEGMEMNASFRLEGDARVEQIHQHRLAAADCPVDVNSPRGAMGCAGEQTQRAAARARGSRLVRQHIKSFRGSALRRSRLEAARRNKIAITLERSLQHRELGLACCDAAVKQLRSRAG